MVKPMKEQLNRLRQDIENIEDDILVVKAPDNDLFFVAHLGDDFAIYEHYKPNHLSIVDINDITIRVTLNTDSVKVAEEYFKTHRFDFI